MFRPLLALLLAAAPAFAQNAVTITGHVSSGRMPLQGASVRIEQLNMATTTDVDGRYSIIIPSSRVQGQTVTLTARYLRYTPASVQVVLVGGSLVQDFDLAPTEGAAVRPRPTDTTVAVSRPTNAATVPVGATPVIRLPRALGGIVIDSSAFLEQSGPVDLASALAGRIAGVEVQSSGALGGTSAVRVRGSRTIVGNTQPLWVVDGVILDNSTATALSQRLGTGGYDYGTPVSDLNVEDIESVRLLRGPAAAMLYGGRAANGVFVVTTRNGRGLSGFDISASQQVSFEEPLRLAEYQNAYGQGLGGAFSFFDGMGGGTNDSVSQSWGPAFVGQPLAQASYTEAGRAEVRPWFAQPNNVSDYFERGRTLATNVAAQGANTTGQFRLSFGNRTSDGLTPDTRLTRQSGTFTGGVRPSSRLDLTASAQFLHDKGSDRPGSGFDESNPVSMLSILPRQVDIDALRNHVRDASGKQINWNYSSHDNPFFAALANDQHDDRSRILGGLSATYAFSNMLQGTLRGGADHYTENRRFDIAPGWLGGFPDFAGRGSFATGGFEGDDIAATQSDVEASLRATPRGEFAFTLGVGRRGNSFEFTPSAFSDTLPAPGAFSVAANPIDAHTLYVRAGAQASLASWATLDASVSHESSSLAGASASELYPAVLASLDLTRAKPEMRGMLLDALTLRAGWSRSGNDVLPATALAIAQQASGVTYDQLVSPEVTAGWDVGARAGLLRSRVTVDVSYYADHTDDLLIPGALEFLRGGQLSNHGIEVQLDAVPVRLSRIEWRVGGSFAQNTNEVVRIPGASTPESANSVALTAPVGGVTLAARVGSPLAAIMGTRFLRDADGALLLRDGHPLPDSVTGPVVLGTSAPSWTGGVSSGLKIWGLDLSVLFDIRQGGKIFSASNRAGAYAGTLAETSFRPDSGLLIAGTDVATGKANAVHVTTEDYYHSLGAIGERWVYDASFVKLREARATVDVPLHSLGLHAQRMRLSIIGRNLALWTNVPNIDPETVVSTSFMGGAELGQLPTVRSVGVQITLTP